MAMNQEPGVGCCSERCPLAVLPEEHEGQSWAVAVLTERAYSARVEGMSTGLRAARAGRGGIGADGEGSGLTSEKPRVIVEINDNAGFIPSFLSESN